MRMSIVSYMRGVVMVYLKSERIIKFEKVRGRAHDLIQTTKSINLYQNIRLIYNVIL